MSEQHTATADPWTGRLLDGRYRIGPRIARGGMATVHEATDTRLERPVAVKILHPGLGDDEEFAERFVREARAAARLNHPHVVGVYDQGNDDGTVYLVMEHVAGRTLRDLITQQAPVPPEQALALLEPVLEALATAHRAGIVHRDVKPENVLLADATPDGGTVKVTDFGLARAVGTETRHTATAGVLVGTVSYLAPELVTEAGGDARADVYAVGVVLYELLTGDKPHTGETPIQVAYQHVHQDVPPPSRQVTGLPAYVDALVARATARDPGLRPADAGVLRHQARRVRQALEAGDAEDAELVADLALPAAPGQPAHASDPAATGTAGASAENTAGLPGDRTGPPTSRPPGDDAEHTVTLSPTPDVPASGPPSHSGAAVGADPGGGGGRTRRRRGPVLLALALVLVLAVGVGAWWFGYARYTPMPGVVGLTAQAAEQRLDQAGLGAERGEPQYSETVPAGRVIETDPDGGERVLDGGTVTYVLSRGKERYDVPSLRGRDVDAAQDALQDTNLRFGSLQRRYHEQVPQGSVLETVPGPGTTLRPDSTVDLVVSRGPRPIEVPDLTGRDAGEAEQTLTDEGLEVTTSREFSAEVPAGDVESQSPDSGTLARGEEVSLVVSQGPEMVEVPDDLVASGVDAARETLEEAGFQVEVVESDQHLGLGYVLRASPGSGEKAPRGSTVTLSLI